MEWLDVYTADHERTGRSVPRNGAVEEGDRLLAVHVCLMNERNELLIQKRSTRKDRYPGCWDLSAGGFAQRGEDAVQAAARELREELGLTPPETALRFLFTEPFSCLLDDLFLLRACPPLEELRLQAEEVDAVRWIGWEELEPMLLDGRFVNYPVDCMRRVFAMAAES